MGKQRYGNGNGQRRNHSTDLRDEHRCKQNATRMAFSGGRVSKGSKNNYQRSSRQNSRFNSRNNSQNKHQHRQQRSGNFGQRSNQRPTSPVVRIPRPCPRTDRATRSDNRGNGHHSKDRNHRTNNNHSNNHSNNHDRQHPKRRSAERHRKHRDLNSNSDSNSNSNSIPNSRERKSQDNSDPLDLISLNSVQDLSPPPLPLSAPPLPPPLPPNEYEFESDHNTEWRENGHEKNRPNDEVTSKNSGEWEAKKSDTNNCEKHRDSPSHSKSKSERTEQDNQGHTSKFTSYKWVKNVLDIPQMYRINFGFPDESQIGNCPIGSQFWYDEEHSGHFKYYIRLYDDSGEWIMKTYILKEQIGLALPQTYDLKISQILEKISNCPYSKRVWIDVRDFDLFSDRMKGLLDPILSHITHLSFGGRLYRFSPTMGAAFGEVEGISLFYYVVNNLRNLEYLCIDDEMLWKLSSNLLPPEIRDKTLPKLHTVRFVSTNTSVYACSKLMVKMTGCYVMRILRVAPNIKRLYGISTQILRDLETENTLSYPFPSVCLNGLVRSLSLKPEPSPLVKESFETYFLQCLSVLHECKPPNWHHLEELDTRTFFYIKTHIQVQCIDAMSKIIDLNKKTIKTLTVKPIRVSYSELKFPPLPRCTTINFEILRNFSNVGSYFSPSLNFRQTFPNVHTVEIWSTGLETASTRGLTNEKTLFNRHFSEWAFEARHSLHRVTSLSLFRYCPNSSIHAMAYLFKNITVLVLDNTLTEVAQFLPNCFEEWPKLRQLILKINTDTRAGDFDEAFTGIKRDKLRELSEPPFKDLLSKVDATDSETSERVQDIIDAYRTKPPISHLKDLHLLKLLLRSGAMIRVPAFTKLSVMYGFGRGAMPKLAVQIGFHHRVTTDDKTRMISALTPVLPYVGLER